MSTRRSSRTPKPSSRLSDYVNIDEADLDRSPVKGGAKKRKLSDEEEGDLQDQASKRVRKDASPQGARPHSAPLPHGQIPAPPFPHGIPPPNPMQMQQFQRMMAPGMPMQMNPYSQHSMMQGHLPVQLPTPPRVPPSSGPIMSPAGQSIQYASQMPRPPVPAFPGQQVPHPTQMKPVQQQAAVEPGRSLPVPPQANFAPNYVRPQTVPGPVPTLASTQTPSSHVSSPQIPTAPAPSHTPSQAPATPAPAPVSAPIPAPVETAPTPASVTASESAPPPAAAPEPTPDSLATAATSEPEPPAIPLPDAAAAPEATAAAAEENSHPTEITAAPSETSAPASEASTAPTVSEVPPPAPSDPRHDPEDPDNIWGGLENHAVLPGGSLLSKTDAELDELLQQGRITPMDFIGIISERSIQAQIQSSAPPPQPPKLVKTAKVNVGELTETLSSMLHSFGTSTPINPAVITCVEEAMVKFFSPIIATLSEFISRKGSTESEVPDETSISKPAVKRVTANLLGEAMLNTPHGDRFVARIAYLMALRRARSTAGADKYSESNLETAAMEINEGDDYSEFAKLGQDEESIINSLADPMAVMKAIEIPFYKNPKFFQWKPKFLLGIDLTPNLKTIYDELRERDELRSILAKNLGDKYEDFAKSYESGLHKIKPSFRGFLSSKCYPSPDTPRLDFKAEALESISFAFHLFLRRVVEIAISIKIMNTTGNYESFYDVDIRNEVTDFVDLSEQEMKEALNVAFEEVASD